ncbi:MAG: ROK family protein [Acidimicrobiia bacterium]
MLTAGIDIGGSSVTAIARDPSGSIVGRYEDKITVEGGSQMAAAVAKAFGELDIPDIGALGVGVPGQIDPRTGRLAMAVNLGVGAQAYDLAGEIESSLRVPVIIENDVRAAALGAWDTFRSSGQSPQSLALVNIGTGISAGVVVEGRLVRGYRGMAGEIGHVVVDESGAVCRCGQRGCLEAVAAGPAIARAWPIGEAGSAATALFSAVAKEDPAAIKVAGRVAGHLTTALIWLAAAYDTEVLVLAGGVAGAGDSLLNLVRDEIERRGATSELAARRLNAGQVSLASEDQPPGALGAALLAAEYLVRLGNTQNERKASSQL